MYLLLRANPSTIWPTPSDNRISLSWNWQLSSYLRPSIPLVASWKPCPPHLRLRLRLHLPPTFALAPVLALICTCTCTCVCACACCCCRSQLPLSTANLSPVHPFFCILWTLPTSLALAFAPAQECAQWYIWIYRDGYVFVAQSQWLNHMAHAQRQQLNKLAIELAAQCTQALHMRRQLGVQLNAVERAGHTRRKKRGKRLSGCTAAAKKACRGATWPQRATSNLTTTTL